MSLDVYLPYFEGPLPLLLYLIRKEEMDIFNIDIHLITQQYFDYIKRMKELDLETAGDFIAMAATLIQIKSQMLLPQYSETGEPLELEDPRKILVDRLLEYQKFQDAAKSLYERPLLGRDLWNRGFAENFTDAEEEAEIILEEGGLYPLISFYRRVMKSLKNKVHHVAIRTKSIASRILEIKDRLFVGKTTTLTHLVEAVEDFRSELLITFLSLLELGKLGFISLQQTDVYTDIHVTPKKEVDGHVIDRVQEYDSHDAASVADALFEEEADFAKTESNESETIDLGAEMASDEDIENAENEERMKETENAGV